MCQRRKVDFHYWIGFEVMGLMLGLVVEFEWVG